MPVVLIAVLSASRSPARADVVCDALGDVSSFGSIAATNLRTKFDAIGGYGNTAIGDLCAYTATLQNTETDAGAPGSFGSLIATKAAGTSLKLKAIHEQDLYRAVLAPRRTVTLRGTNFDGGTRIGAVYAGRVPLSGYAVVGEPRGCD